MSEINYSEKVLSAGTTLLFLFLSLLFLLLFGWRISIIGWRFFTVLLFALSLIFLFYTINYRVLRIRLTTTHLILRFGIVPWKTPLKNILSVQLDDSPPLIKYGGAGVHFAFVDGKYRAFYNFLEYPRLLVTFKKKQGVVQELVFTTRKPEKIMDILTSMVSEQ